MVYRGLVRGVRRWVRSANEAEDVILDVNKTRALTDGVQRYGASKVV